MIRKWINNPPAHPARGLDIIRIGIALIILVHPLHGLAHPDSMNGFGGFLSSRGFPFGVTLAWALTFVQVASSIALILRRLIIASCIGNMCILVPGLWIAHGSDGWFTVGPGRNGIEYSMTLIVCLFGIILAYWPDRKSTSTAK